ncbi:MAG: ABC transporter permease [Gemmatimonadetes bacterium]|nr:ABC transporter permease [Gemmatimonadota bacterium]
MSRPPRWIRRLLAVLPARFRAEHGEEIIELGARYARGRSVWGRATVWMCVAADLVVVGLGYRFTRRSAGVEERLPSSKMPTMEGVGRDVRMALRSLRRDPGFSVFSVLIVGLGIGASITVFSVVQALLIRPLPFEEPDRLVWVSNGDFGRGQQLSSISVQVGHVVRMRADASQLDDIAGYHLFDRDGDHTLVSGDAPARVTRLRVTGNFLSVLGVEPAIGRFFTDEEAWDDGPRAIVLTHGSWLRHFGGDPGIVGSHVLLDDASASVVGVLPASFDFTTIFAPGQSIDYLAPYPLSARSHRSGNTLGLIARLAADATLASARAEIGTFAVSEEEAAERENTFHPVIRPLREHVSGGFRPAMLLLVGAVVLVMLIVCANLSTLHLARATGRERELAIRAAMGAGRGRLFRELLTETVVVSGLGAALGVLVAVQGTRLLSTLDLQIPMLSHATVDGHALTIAVLSAVAVGVVFGLAPAVRGARLQLNEALKEGARGASGSRRHQRLRHTLVVSQVAIACLLLVASTLTARSMLHLLETDLGYDAKGAVAMRIDPAVRFDNDEERLTFYGSVLDRVGGSSGVAAAGLSDILPMAFNRRWDARAMNEDPENRVFPYVRIVSDGYLDAMGLTLVAGRDFTSADVSGTTDVAILNEPLAARLWGDRSPLGQTLRSSGRERTVVGVVRPTRQLSVDQEPGPELFLALRQVWDHAAVYLIIRGERTPTELIEVARGEIGAIDPAIPLDRVVRVSEIVGASMAPRRFVTTLLTLFAAFAVVLAALGIYAVVSYSVTQRRHEIGIHLALGATGRRVRRGFTRETLTLTGLGLFIGLVGAGFGGRVLESSLIGVTPLDPATYVAVSVVLLGVSLAAAWAPVRSASRVSPLEVLNQG